jgi:hypothetical protein
MAPFWRENQSVWTQKEKASKESSLTWRTKMQAKVLARVQGKVLGFNLLQMNPN